jgi:GNAT superfamily N-acetyltransferase
MLRLPKTRYDSVYEKYRQEDYFFPLIAAVLLDDQDGVVYADNTDSPSQVYVEHGFGFSQLFGETVPGFMRDLEDYLIKKKAFHSSKVRLYSPSVPAFLSEPTQEASYSQRQRFYLNHARFLEKKQTVLANKNIKLKAVEADEVALIEKHFGVVTRFWRSPDAFFQKSGAHLALYKGEPASICYSAAVADGHAEIDVLTLPEFRKLGIGRYVVADFIDHCRSVDINPVWDCFANNIASLALADSIGFVPYKSPYAFFTINA